jgi:small subunit ribosomal protein S16
MLRIRLRRVGKRKQPSYRIVVTDSRTPRDSAYIDQVGFYDPHREPSVVTLDKEKAASWLGRGAQPSEPVQRILRKAGLLGEAESHAGAH